MLMKNTMDINKKTFDRIKNSLNELNINFDDFMKIENKKKKFF